MGVEILDMNLGCPSLQQWKSLDKDCILPLISKVLGYLIIASSVVIKAPQISRILKNRSIKGLSLPAFELEVIGYTIGLAYCIDKGVPFSAYGEYFFLAIQSIILVSIIYYFSQPLGAKKWTKAALFCAIAPTLYVGRIDPLTFEALFVSQHAIFFFARVPQMWENYKNQGTGELSFLTCFMNFAGSAVRIFTSIQEHAPANLIFGSELGILTNGIILYQFFIYQNPDEEKQKKA